MLFLPPQQLCGVRSRRRHALRSKETPRLSYLARGNLCLRRRLRAEDALETFAVLQEDQNPQNASEQSGRDAAWRHRQVKRKDVVELRSKQCQRKWHEKAEEQQQPTKDLHREEESGEVRCSDGNKKLDCHGIRRWRLVDKMKKPVQSKDRKHHPQQIARNNRSNLHAVAPWRLRACVCTT
jgi:hypothetical protein